MKSNYKRLGDYIQLADQRNRDLSITNLLGVSIEKRINDNLEVTLNAIFAERFSLSESR